MTTVDLYIKEARKLNRHNNSWVNYALRLVLQEYEKLDKSDDEAVERFYSWAMETLCPAFWGVYEMHFLYGDRDPEQWLKENTGYLYRLERLLIDGKGEALKQMRDKLPMLFNMPSAEDVPAEEVMCACDGDCSRCDGQQVECKDCKYCGDIPDDEKVVCACEDGDCMDCNGQNVACKDCKYGGCKNDIDGDMPVMGVDVRVP